MTAIDSDAADILQRLNDRHFQLPSYPSDFGRDCLNRAIRRLNSLTEASFCLAAAAAAAAAAVTSQKCDVTHCLPLPLFSDVIIAP